MCISFLFYSENNQDRNRDRDFRDGGHDRGPGRGQGRDILLDSQQKRDRSFLDRDDYEYDRSRHRRDRDRHERRRSDDFGRDRRDSRDRDRDREHRPIQSDSYKRKSSFDRDYDEDRNFDVDIDMDRFDRRNQGRNRRYSDEDKEHSVDKNGSNSDYEDETNRHPRDEKRRRVEHDQDRDRNRGPRFPGPFEFFPSDYVLDSTSGYFYEEHCDFFHDPKSKLYFHNGTKRYYSFDKDDDRFISVEDDYGKLKMKIATEKQTSLDKGNDLIVQALQGSQQKSDPTAGTKKISIMIKQKPKKSKKNVKKDETAARSDVALETVKANQAVAQLEQIQKDHHDDIEKWAKRVAPSAKIQQDPTRPIMARKTKSGKFVCMPCLRKFESKNKYENHVFLSEYHKFNISKLKKSESSIIALEYMDRAKHRRTLYGKEQPAQAFMDVKEVEEIMAPNLKNSREIVSSQIMTPEGNLGASNVGNKMLQKLGWKKGESLGRMTSAADNSVNNPLKKDWERIESMAASRR